MIIEHAYIFFYVTSINNLHSSEVSTTITHFLSPLYKWGHAAAIIILLLSSMAMEY
jgi:hypothetical protein